MANYGAKSPIFAPFQGVEPAAADPTYGAGIIIGKLVSCVVTPNNAEGDLPADADCATLSAYLMAVMHGMAVQAKAGFPRETLMAVAEQALKAWPRRA